MVLEIFSPLSTDGAERQLAAHVHTSIVHVEDHLGLLGYVARRFLGHGLEFEELVDEGFFGLVEAVRRFDPANGASFSTFAYYWIKQAIIRALREQVRAIRLPDYLWGELKRLRAQRKAFWEQYQRTPTLDELAEALQCDRARVAFLVSAGREIASLDQPIQSHLVQHSEDEEDNWLDSLVAPDPTMQLEQEADVDALLEYLSPEERRVIVCRYQLGQQAYAGVEEIPLHYTEAARQLHMTREHVKVVEERALLKMRYWAGRSSFQQHAAHLRTLRCETA